ncbi:MAG TPA: BON domain-containing protein [Usitatibacter sp.]|nr:BON domain-containing protein [Usitatibacter sp.]
MKARLHIAIPLLLATTAALAATGYTLQSSETHPYAAPAASDNWVAPAPNEQPAASTNATQSIAAPAVAPAPVAAPAPAPYEEPRVEINAPRLSEDELLRNAVMDRLANDRALAGKVGVEAYRHTVSLTGRVTTTGQIERASTLARSVDGVWRVDNYLLARVGMS